MTIGYVHAGAPEHGVTRYGRLLAAEARRRPDLHVLEAEVRLTGDHGDRGQIADAAGTLAAADVIHLQYNNQITTSVWGPRWSQLTNLRRFARTAGRPLVATVHDVYAGPSFSWTDTVRDPRSALRTARSAAPGLATLRWLRRQAHLLVCSDAERARIPAPCRGLSVIPHFVEPREIPASRADAKAALGLERRTVVTVLGYIHHRKGHDLVVDALSRLPDDVFALFAGGAPVANSPFVDNLLARATEHGVADRVRVTGFLRDEELGRFLAATDLALCPFRALSASGSLSTWISAGRPILASDLPQIAEYNALEPGAIRTFHPYTPHALAEAIRDALVSGNQQEEAAIRRLRARLLLPSTFERHLDVYRGLMAGRIPARREEQWATAR